MHKHMLRALGLSLLAALGLMAFTAAGAQAEALKGVAGKIKIAGADAAAGTLVEGSQEGSGTLKIPALNTEIVCEKVKVLKGEIISGSKGEGLGQLLYEECVTWGTKGANQELTTKLAECEILEHSASLAKGAILANALLLVVLHEVSAGVSDTYILAEPDPSVSTTTLANVLYTTPSGCSLPKLIEIKGSVVFKVTLGDLALGQAEELYVLGTASKELSSSGLFTDELKFGINPAFIDGSALLWLASDKNWGVI